MTWHANPETVAAYVGGALDSAAAASVEAHVVACTTCQQLVADAAPTVIDGRLDRVWANVVDTLDAPEPRPVERFLRRLGIRETDARLVACTPALFTSWAIAVTAAVVLTLIPGRTDGRAAFAFLLFAPLLPLVAVAAAFSPRFDRAWEVTAATPLAGLHLLLVRGLAALLPALAATTVAALAVPGEGLWLLPAAALCAWSLAAATWVEPVTAAGTLASLWMSGVVYVQVGSARGLTGDAAAAILSSPTSQSVALAFIAAALAVVIVRRQSFEFGR